MLLIERVFFMKKCPLGYSRHHRDPKSLGGSDDDRNISIVIKSEHKAWHNLFDNLPVLDVFRLFNFYWEMFGDESKLLYETKQTGLSVLKNLILLHEQSGIFGEDDLIVLKNTLNSYKLEIKQKRAWIKLFGGLSLEEIIIKINKDWIDPDYGLIIVVVPKRIVALKHMAYAA
jgi:hypothetical protein